jgi:hypothetical protein
LNRRKSSFDRKGIAMQEPSGIRETPRTNTADADAPASTPNTSERDKGIQSAIALGSLALIGCFFLPWIAILAANLSGYQIQQLPSDEARLVWAIPLGGLLSFFAAVAKQGVAVAAPVAGAIPFLALIYYRAKLGEDFFGALQPGAYLTLVVAGVLFVLPRFMTKQRA